MKKVKEEEGKSSSFPLTCKKNWIEWRKRSSFIKKNFTSNLFFLSPFLSLFLFSKQTYGPTLSYINAHVLAESCVDN